MDKNSYFSKRDRKGLFIYLLIINSVEEDYNKVSREKDKIAKQCCIDTLR